MKALLICYDNDGYTNFFPQGIAYVAAALRKAGHDVTIWNQDVHHLPEADLTALLDRELFDLVGLGFCAGYYQFRRAIKIGRAVNRSKNRGNFVFVLGGHGPAAEPEWFLDKLGANIVVKGECERVVNFTAGFQGREISGAVEIGALPGESVDDIPWPAYDLFPIDIYRLIRWPTSKRTDFCMPILSGRGCKWKCSFCYRMVPGFRPRSPEAVIEEMGYLNREWGINHFQFSDELFMSSSERIQTFCDAMLEAETHKWAKWDCNGRLNFASEENLEIMREAGCEYINYGCEAMDDEVLRLMKKGLTVEQIEEGTRRTIEADISPGLNFMWGNPGDTPATLRKAVDFLLRWDPCHELRTIRPVTPYPGCPLYQEAIKKALLGGPEDFYEHKHINSDWPTVNFMEGVTDGEFTWLLKVANRRLLENFYKKRQQEAQAEATAFYNGDNPEFRGFRAV